MHLSHKWNHEYWECPKRNNKVIYRFGKHDKRADGWKLATICSTRVRKSVPQYQSWKEKGERKGELYRVAAGESSASRATYKNTSFATPSSTKRTVAKIWVSKTCGESQYIYYFFPCRAQWFQICYLVHVNSQVRFSTTVVWSFSNKKQKLGYLNHFCLVQKECKE